MKAGKTNNVQEGLLLWNEHHNMQWPIDNEENIKTLNITLVLCF